MIGSPEFSRPDYVINMRVVPESSKNSCEAGVLLMRYLGIVWGPGPREHGSGPFFPLIFPEGNPG